MPRHRQLALFKGVHNKPRRRKRTHRPTPCLDRVKNVLSGRLRADGCVQLGIERIAKLAAATARHVKRVVGQLVKAGWMRVIGREKKGQARTYEVARKVAPKILARTSAPAAPHRVTNSPSAEVTNGVTSCIPPHPPCIYPSQITNKLPEKSAAEPEFVVIENARTVEKQTGMAIPAAIRLVRRYGTPAVRKALALMHASIRNVVDPPAWLSAALRDGYRHRNDRGPVAIAPEELERRRQAAARQIAAAEAEAPWNQPRQEPAPETIPLQTVIAGRFAFLRKHTKPTPPDYRVKLLRQLEALAKGGA